MSTLVDSAPEVLTYLECIYSGKRYIVRLPVLHQGRRSFQHSQHRLASLFGGFGHNFDTAEGQWLSKLRENIQVARHYAITESAFSTMGDEITERFLTCKNKSVTALKLHGTIFRLAAFPRRGLIWLLADSAVVL